MFALYDDKQLYNFLSMHKQSFPIVGMYGDELVEDHYKNEKFAGLYEGITYFHAALPKADFVKEYKARFGTDPVFGAGPAYDAVMIFAKMFKEKGLQGDQQATIDYNSYLRSTAFETVSYGTMTFDPIGGVKTANNQFDLWKIQQGVAEKVGE